MCALNANVAPQIGDQVILRPGFSLLATNGFHGAGRWYYTICVLYVTVSVPMLYARGIQTLIQKTILFVEFEGKSHWSIQFQRSRLDDLAFE